MGASSTTSTQHGCRSLFPLGSCLLWMVRSKNTTPLTCTCVASTSMRMLVKHTVLLRPSAWASGSLFMLHGSGRERTRRLASWRSPTWQMRSSGVCRMNLSMATSQWSTWPKGLSFSLPPSHSSGMRTSNASSHASRASAILILIVAPRFCAFAKFSSGL